MPCGGGGSASVSVQHDQVTRSNRKGKQGANLVILAGGLYLVQLGQAAIIFIRLSLRRCFDPHLLGLDTPVRFLHLVILQDGLGKLVGSLLQGGRKSPLRPDQRYGILPKRVDAHR